MSVAVVTPWLDHRELARDYIDAIIAGPLPDELIVVDNGSQPPLPFASIRNTHNEGFAKACNQGLHAATSDVVVFLNNDIASYGAGWLTTLTSHAEPGVLVGAQLRNDPHGWVDGQPQPYLDGWCVGGMRDDLLDLGGFDTGYQEPAYYSDNDLSARARHRGMRLVQVQIPLRHKLNATAGPANTPQVAAATIHNQQRYRNIVRQLATEVPA